jgi:hypothetical protein
MGGRAKAYLSYEESLVRLQDFFPLVEEVAEKQAMLAVVQKSQSCREAAQVRDHPLPALEFEELWSFFESLVECICDREQVISEFRRASRYLLRASHAVFILRCPDGFRADRGEFHIPFEDPLIAYLQDRPVIIDSATWTVVADPMTEVGVRRALSAIGARLFIPIHSNGLLLGLIALGVRDDGVNYDQIDYSRAVRLARLMRLCIGRYEDFNKLQRLSERNRLGVKYLPSSLILGPEESTPRNLPLVVRDLIGQVLRHRRDCSLSPSVGQPFRAKAGPIEESRGIWVWWEESGGDVRESEEKLRENRREILRELALTLSHEVSNALVPLSVLRQSPVGRPLPESLVESFRASVVQLENLNDTLSVMQALHEVEPIEIDFRDMAQRVGFDLGITLEVGPNPVQIKACERLLQFAVLSILKAVADSCVGDTKKCLVAKLRQTGSGDCVTALLSLGGVRMELEGVLRAPVASNAPDQGRMDVLIAKEILLLHRGEIHSGPGMEGTEIHISIQGL